jgi:hypothetical protein
VARGETGFIACGSPRMGGAENDWTGGTGRGAALGTHCQAAGWISSGLASRGRFDREAGHSWLAALYRLELSFPCGRLARLAGFVRCVDRRGPSIRADAHGRSAPEVSRNCPFALSGKTYKFISSMVAFVRLWGVAGFHLLEALMSTHLVRSNRGMSCR